MGMSWGEVNMSICCVKFSKKYQKCEQYNKMIRNVLCFSDNGYSSNFCVNWRLPRFV